MVCKIWTNKLGSDHDCKNGKHKFIQTDGWLVKVELVDPEAAVKLGKQKSYVCIHGWRQADGTIC